jgi:hypothetical protein
MTLAEALADLKKLDICYFNSTPADAPSTYIVRVCLCREVESQNPRTLTPFWAQNVLSGDTLMDSEVPEMVVEGIKRKFSTYFR